MAESWASCSKSAAKWRWIIPWRQARRILSDCGLSFYLHGGGLGLNIKQKGPTGKTGKSVWWGQPDEGENGRSAVINRRR